MENSSAYPLVSVIVLNYNGMDFVEDCFQSLKASSYPSQEWIMVDNASSDDSVAYVRSHHPEVKVIETGKNLGYSGAYNRSFQEANGKYYVLLNNDTKVDKGWLEPLVEEAEADPGLGTLQPKIRSMIDEGYFEYAGAAGGHMDRYGFPFLRGRIFGHIEKDEGQYDDPSEIFWSSGAAMFLRADMLRYTGGLDDDFFLHMEEIDLCWRAQLHGFRSRSIPRSRVFHYVGASLPQESHMKLFYNHRNSLMMLKKNVGDERLRSTLFKRSLLDLLAMAKGILSGELFRARAVIEAYRWNRRNQEMIKKKRKEVQGQRIVDDERIFCKLYPRSIALDHFIFGKKRFSQVQERFEAQKDH